MDSTSTNAPANGEGKTDWKSHIPAWAAVVAGIIYSTGFLIDTTFLHSMGIEEPNLEAFKAKYIYIGLVALQFPLTAGLLFLGLTEARKQNPAIPIHTPTVWIIFVLLLSFFLLNTFTTADFFSAHKIELALLFFFGTGNVLWLRMIDDNRLLSNCQPTTKREFQVWFVIAFSGLMAGVALFKELAFLHVFTLALVIAFCYKARKDPRPPKVWFIDFSWPERNALRYSILIIMSLWMIFVFRDLWPLLFNMAYYGAWIYVLLMGVAGIFIYLATTTQAKGGMMAINLCAPFTFLYLATLVFAYRVYPYIPIQRGGGDYSSDNITCTLCVNYEGKAALSPFFRVDADDEFYVTVLDENSTTLFVTYGTTPEERSVWKAPGNATKPSPIIALKRDTVISIRTKSLDTPLTMGYCAWLRSDPILCYLGSIKTYWFTAVMPVHSHEKPYHHQ